MGAADSFGWEQQDHSLSLAAQNVVEHPSLAEAYWVVKKGLAHHATLAAGALPAVGKKPAHLSIPNDLYPVRSFCSQLAVLSWINALWDYYSMRFIPFSARDDPIPHPCRLNADHCLRHATEPAS